jgi:hypothetical protein
MDDHRGLMPSDLKIPALPPREPKAAGGASGARFHPFDQLNAQASAGRLETVPFPLATRLRVVLWHAEKGAKLKFNLPVARDGRFLIRLVAVHRPDGATVRLLVDDTPLPTEGGADTFQLKSAYAPRLLNVPFKAVDLKASSHRFTLECVETGAVGLDYLWERNP